VLGVPQCILVVAVSCVPTGAYRFIGRYLWRSALVVLSCVAADLSLLRALVYAFFDLALPLCLIAVCIASCVGRCCCLLGSPPSGWSPSGCAASGAGTSPGRLGRCAEPCSVAGGGGVKVS